MYISSGNAEAKAAGLYSEPAWEKPMIYICIYIYELMTHNIYIHIYIYVYISSGNAEAKAAGLYSEPAWEKPIINVYIYIYIYIN
jgi:hypothetical protein